MQPGETLADAQKRPPMYTIGAPGGGTNSEK
jgi:hypothetical protein